MCFQRAGYRVLAPDLRGFGQQPLEPAPFSYVRDVEALLDGPTAVVGNSLGGRVALELAVLPAGARRASCGDCAGLAWLGVV